MSKEMMVEMSIQGTVKDQLTAETFMECSERYTLPELSLIISQ